MISGIVNATSQNSSTITGKQNTTVTWLEANNTNTRDTPMISVSGDDFWAVFEPLLEQPINRSAILSE